MQVTGERKFLELHSVQRQTHKVYEPAVGKHTKTPNPALGRALREYQSRQRCFHWGAPCSALSQPGCVCGEALRLSTGGAAGMGAPTALLFSCFSKPRGIDPVRCPSPRAEEEAASVLFPSTLVPLQYRKQDSGEKALI